MPNSNKKNLRIILNSGAILRIPKIDINSVTFPETKINNRYMSKKIEFNVFDSSGRKRHRR